MTRTFRLMTIAFALTISFIGLAGTVAQEASPTPMEPVELAGPGSTYEGLTYAEWSARWWEWALSFPAIINPGADPDGTVCGLGQHGPVFFLATSGFDTAGLTRSCTVPEGVALFIPVIGADCSTVEEAPFNGTDEASLAACATSVVDQITDAALVIDGTDVAELATYRVQTPVANVILPIANILGVAPGPASLIGDGVSVLVEPLSAGTHTIAFGGTYPNGNTLAVTYDLTVDAATVPST